MLAQGLGIPGSIKMLYNSDLWCLFEDVGRVGEMLG